MYKSRCYLKRLGYRKLSKILTLDFDLEQWVKSKESLQRGNEKKHRRTLHVSKGGKSQTK